MKCIVLTGVSRGLGNALFDILIRQDYYLICISRSFNSLQIKMTGSKSVEFLQLDLNDINTVATRLHNSIILNNYKFDELIFINNAATVTPIGKVGSLNDKDIIKTINVNFVSPFLLTNYLSNFCKRNNIRFRILNITTGAADKPFEGWSVYCSTKSATKMFFGVFEKERGALVENIDPGVLDTHMQDEIRKNNPTDFPLVDSFKNLSKENKLKNPFEIAKHILNQSGLI